MWHMVPLPPWGGRDPFIKCFQTWQSRSYNLFDRIRRIHTRDTRRRLSPSSGSSVDTEPDGTHEEAEQLEVPCQRGDPMPISIPCACFLSPFTC